MQDKQANIDESDQAHFDELANHWWDTSGRLNTLHAINPVRLAYIRRFVTLENCRVIDVGCGGGLLSEAMASEGASVTGIDTGERAIGVARDHARQNNLDIDYIVSNPEAHAEKFPHRYDLVTCMELLEHVPDAGAIITACARLARPGGHVVFSTLNRTAMSWALAIFGAEYVCRLLPRGTHDYARFVRPSELDRWCRDADIGIDDVSGMTYLPLVKRALFADSTAVNYLAHGRTLLSPA